MTTSDYHPELLKWSGHTLRELYSYVASIRQIILGIAAEIPGILMPG